MEIVLKEPHNKFAKQLYLGNRYRCPSVTDVVFVCSDRIVVAHRYACKLYYIQLDESAPNHYRMLDEVVLHVRGQQHQTEMMEICGNTLYVISYTEHLTIVDVVDDTLRIRNTVSLNQTQSPYHGIQIDKNRLYITPSNKAKGDDSIIVWNTDTNTIIQRLHSPDIGSNIRIKDITFLSNDRIVLLGNYKAATSMIEKGHTFNGFIGLYTSDFRLLHRLSYTATQFESVTSKDGIFYATGSDLEGGYIYTGHMIGDALSQIVKYPTEDFPHGITIHNDKLAYTSYATSAVYITNVSTFSTLRGLP